MLAIFKAAFSAAFPVGLIADSFLALYKELELCDYIFITAAFLAVVVLMLRRDSIFYANGIIVINLGAVIAQFGRQSDENIPLLYNRQIQKKYGDFQ